MSAARRKPDKNAPAQNETLQRDQEIRLLRRSLEAIRQRFVEDIDAIDQQLSSLQSTAASSFQVPKSWDGWIEAYKAGRVQNFHDRVNKRKR